MERRRCSCADAADLDKHLGAPPAEFVYRGKKYSPVSFAKEIVRLPWDNYVRVMSFQYAPFYANAVLKVPDNWMNDSSFYNVPLDVWYQSMKTVWLRVTHSHSIADISEPGYRLGSGTVIVPQYDIPMNAITQEAREFVFPRCTVDDSFDAGDRYTRQRRRLVLVKDSWRTAYQSEHPGYLFIDESYMKLKVLAYMVHRTRSRTLEGSRTPITERYRCIPGIILCA